MRGVRTFWDEKSISLLMELRDDEAMEWGLIAEELGRTVDQCKQKYQAERARRGHRPQSRIVPNAALIDRERRERARDAASLTTRTFGDPPPGFSALDRRRASA
jgi:hypothetical protein